MKNKRGDFVKVVCRIVIEKNVVFYLKLHHKPLKGRVSSGSRRERKKEKIRKET